MSRPTAERLAEIWRLHAEGGGFDVNRGVVRQLREEINALTEEREQLRAALERMADLPFENVRGESIRIAAREALAGVPAAPEKPLTVQEEIQAESMGLSP